MAPAVGVPSHAISTILFCGIALLFRYYSITNRASLGPEESTDESSSQNVDNGTTPTNLSSHRHYDSWSNESSAIEELVEMFTLRKCWARASFDNTNDEATQIDYSVDRTIESKTDAISRKLSSRMSSRDDVDQEEENTNISYENRQLRSNIQYSLLPSTSFHDYRRRKHIERKKYNASILPSKLVMVRHGQSAGNVIENLYAQMPDNAIPLTDLGWEQAKMAGRALKESILRKGETVRFIVSPYVRTMETFHGIVSAWCDPSEFNHLQDLEERKQAWYARLHEYGISWHEDPRIREQDFGNYQDPTLIQQCKKERDKFGVFYYRFPRGESATDVFDRVSTFLDSLWRSFDTARYQNCVLVTHGIAIRVLLARYFRYSVDEFHELVNPKNCEMIVLEHDGSGMLRLGDRCQLEMTHGSGKNLFNKSGENGNHSEHSKVKVTGYKFHKGLRMYPEKSMQEKRRVIRLSPNG